MEEKKNAIEEAVRFLDELETENEEELTKMIEAIQDVEQKEREVEYSLQEFDQRQNSNMNFFSPVGVYEEGEEKKNLVQAAENLKMQLPKLNKRLEQHQCRRKQIQYIRDSFLSARTEAAPASVSKAPVLNQEQELHNLETQEQDRNRVTQNLQDSSIQSLAGLIHKTELCIHLMDIDTIRVKLELQTMIETMETMINELRKC